MKKVYENRYGRLEVESVSDLLQVRNIRGNDFPDDIKFDVMTAEQIVLITDNRQSQVAFQDWALGIGYLVIHESPSTGYVCRIVSLNYTGPNAEQEIERLRPRHMLV